jgi:tetratricopeptide (TPR) repeat protein
LKADSQSMAANDNYGRPYLIKGNIHMALKKYDLAVDDYTTAMFKYGPNMKMLPLLYTNRAESKMRLGKIKDAINDYSFSIKLDTTNNKIAYWNRGAAYNKNGDYQLASNDYTKAITFYQGDNANLSKLYNDRAMNELGLNQFAQAIADDSLAITYDATNMYAYLYRAITYTQSAEYQKAVFDYHSVILLKHDDKSFLSRIYYQVASDEYFLNEFDKVISDCTKAITYDPGYSEAYYYRAKVYLKKMKDKDLAAKDFAMVLSLDTTKKSVSYVFSLLYTGKSGEAISILQDDLLHADENIRTTGDYYNLACAYAIMNQPDEANSYLKKAMDNGYSKKYVIADEDLDNIRNTDDYKATIASAAN